MKTKRFVLLLVACASLLSAVSTGQGGVTIWLSPVTTIGGEASMGNPSIIVGIGVPFRLGVWVSSPAGEVKVNTVGLDLVETAGILSATGIEFMETGLNDEAARWGGTIDGNMNESATSLFSGSTTVGIEHLGLTSSAMFRVFDANYDAAADDGNGAFLFAILEITPTAVGHTSLFLKVGSRKIGYSPSSSTDIGFGAGDAPVDRTLVGAMSSLADATVIVPEPATLSLLVIGGVIMIRKRRPKQSD